MSVYLKHDGWTYAKVKEELKKLEDYLTKQVIEVSEEVLVFHSDREMHDWLVHAR